MAERVRLHGMANGGAAVGRLADGAAVFVHGGLAGETAEVEVVERRRNFARARLLTVLDPSPARVEPPCPHFLEGCGGCQWQHAAYDAQLAFKRDVLLDQLRRLGGIDEPPLLESVPSPLEFGYRDTAEFHVRNGAVGFNREGSHELVDVRSCPLISDSMNGALEVVRAIVPPAPGTIESVEIRAGADALLLTLYMQDDPRGYRILGDELATAIGGECRVAGVRIGSDRTRGLHGQPHVYMRLARRQWRLSAQSFFQVNLAVAERLCEAVLPFAPRGGRVLDLFAGVGVFGLLLADAAADVVAVESSAPAIADAEANRAEAAADNLRVISGEVAPAHVEGRWDVVVLDPPRAGCPRPVLDVLEASRIVYVSCDPSTLARDLKVLIARGYGLDSVQPFDMFPQTFHIETLAVLSR
ncbi:MAG: class I SAM-dependent RNA methyltransferase [Chloroflexi bacterium]|nr:class I SAM-dependent RNA methyltransferase [Chloroflexota bacterium]